MKIGQTVYLWNGDLKTKPIKDKILRVTEKTIRLENDSTIFRRNYLGNYYNKNVFKIFSSKNEVNNSMSNDILGALRFNLIERIPEEGIYKHYAKISKSYNLLNEVIESIEKEKNG